MDRFLQAVVARRREAFAWAALGLGANAQINAVSYSSFDGNLYVGGDFTSIGGVSANRIACWDGNTWTNLGTGMNASVKDIVCDSSGNMYAGGSFTTAGGVTVNHVAKWNGSAWSSLLSGANNTINSLDFDSSGNLWAGGIFTQINFASSAGIARWDGAAWNSAFFFGNTLQSKVNVVHITDDDTVYAGGFFTGNIKKWGGGSVWSSLGTDVNNDVLALGSDSNNLLYVGGLFTDKGNYIATWDDDTTTWGTLGSGLNNSVFAINVDSSENPYIGGTFTSPNKFTKWNGASFEDIDSGVTDTVLDIDFDSSGNVYVGGIFLNAGSTPVVVNRIAKWGK